MIDWCYTHERIAAFCKPAILSGEPCDTDEERMRVEAAMREGAKMWDKEMDKASGKNDQD